jgi:4-phytase/acid phosphatase
MRLLFVLLLGAGAGLAQAPKLEYVVILSRHGVRSPTAPAADLRQYARDPWPTWSVAPGELTEHGGKLMAALGGWYRKWLAQDNLLAGAGCGDARAVYLRADVGQRTFESGRAFARGMFPDCAPEVHRVTADADPLFHPVAAGLVHGDGVVAAASVSGRVGGNAAALAGVYRHASDTLGEVLGKQALLEMPASIQGTEDGLADIRGPLRTGSTLAENLLLEYAEGFTGKDLGWGRLDAGKLNEIMAIHTAYADLARRTPYLASVQGSNLLHHILLSLEQAVSAKAVAGALGPPGSRVLVLAGHDTNLSHVAGLLNLSWLIPGYQRDDAPPGGSLVFRLWRGAGGTFSVEVQFIAQTLEQMRDAVPLDLASPPGVAKVFVPGCTPAGARLDCDWTAFRRRVSEAIDRKYTLP